MSRADELAARLQSSNLRGLSRLVSTLALLLLVVLPAVSQEVESTKEQNSTAEQEAPTVKRIGGPRVEFFGQPVVLRANQWLDGSVVVIGGKARIDGDVSQHVVTIFGTAEVNGDVGGNVVSVMGRTKLGKSSIDGTFVNVLGPLEDDGAAVKNGYYQIPGFNIVPEMGPVLLWIKLFHKLVVFIVMVFLVLIAPRRVRQLGDEAPLRYLTAVFVGLGTYVIALLIATVLSPTIIGSIFVWITFLVFKWLGIAGLFFAIGRRLFRGVGVEPALLGGMLLAFAFYTAICLAPAFFGLTGIAITFFVLKPVFFVLFEAPAIGLVVLTRAGANSEADIETIPPTATTAESSL